MLFLKTSIYVRLFVVHPYSSDSLVKNTIVDTLPWRHFCKHARNSIYCVKHTQEWFWGYVCNSILHVVRANGVYSSSVSQNFSRKRCSSDPEFAFLVIPKQYVKTMENLTIQCAKLNKFEHWDKIEINSLVVEIAKNLKKILKILTDVFNLVMLAYQKTSQDSSSITATLANVEFRPVQGRCGEIGRLSEPFERIRCRYF
jgi:hypothetical protein